MRYTSAMLFIVMLNLSAGLVNASGIFGYQQQFPITASDLLAKVYSGDWMTILASIGIAGSVGGVVALLAGSMFFAMVLVLILALFALAPVTMFIINGVPATLATFGVPIYITSVIQAAFAFILFMWVMEFIMQRQQL
jgi:hypothetical protein